MDVAGCACSVVLPRQMGPVVEANILCCMSPLSASSALRKMHFEPFCCRTLVILSRSIYIDTYTTKDWAQLHTWIAAVRLCVSAFVSERG